MAKDEVTRLRAAEREAREKWQNGIEWVWVPKDQWDQVKARVSRLRDIASADDAVRADARPAVPTEEDRSSEFLQGFEAALGSPICNIPEHAARPAAPPEEV